VDEPQEEQKAGQVIQMRKWRTSQRIQQDLWYWCARGKSGN